MINVIVRTINNNHDGDESNNDGRNQNKGWNNDGESGDSRWKNDDNDNLDYEDQSRHNDGQVIEMATAIEDIMIMRIIITKW